MNQMRAWALLWVIAALVTGCAPQQAFTIQQRRIPVITDATLPQKYRVLGEVTGDGGAAWGSLDIGSATAAISVAAQEKFGPEVDAVIQVQYIPIKGPAYGTTIGTRAKGLAVHLEGDAPSANDPRR